ncbi:MAG: STAS domain-containing protein [Candidatus Omnitrophota bacterium]
MAEQFYKIDEDNGVNIITLLKDDIDVHHNDELRKAFSNLLREGKNSVAIDLSNTTYICTIMVVTLVIMYKKSKEAGGRFAVCNVYEKVKKVLTLIKLDKIFDIFNSRQEAIDYLRKK